MNIKRSLLYLSLILTLSYSCKKSNSGGGNTSPSPYYLSSAVGMSAQRRIIDSFYYDSLHRLDTFSQTIYDTTAGSPDYNTWYIQFIYQDTSSRPSWYNYYDPPLGGYGDYHLLSFDAAGRITKDTSLSGSGEVVFFSYPEGQIATTYLPEGSAYNNTTDTLYFSNGNITREVTYLAEVPGQPDALIGMTSYYPSSSVNPAFHPAISNGIGPLLFTYSSNNYAVFVDFISKNAWRSVQGDAAMAFNLGGIDYTLTTDNKGRLTKMAGVSSVSTATATIVFTYY